MGEMTPHDKVFMPVSNIRTFKADLRRAGIDYMDEQGKPLDFQALRYVRDAPVA